MNRNFLIVFFILLLLPLVIFRATGNMEEISFFVSTIGVFFGMFSAIVINDVWERFGNIRDSVIKEISAISSVLDYSQAIDEEISEKIKKLCSYYISEWVMIEWEEYHKKTKADEIFEKIKEEVLRMKEKVDHPGEIALYYMLIQNLDSWDSERSLQKVLSSTRLSMMHWILLFISSFLLVFSTKLAVNLKSYIGNFIFLSVVAISIAILWIIYVLDSLKFREVELFVIPQLETLKELDLGIYEDTVRKLKEIGLLRS